jgi:hypothetical protein
VKYKVGYQQVEQDLAVIRAARSEAGDDLQVMVVIIRVYPWRRLFGASSSLKRKR